MPDTFIKIASVTVGSGGAGNVIFTSIPQTYTDLCIKASIRDNHSGVVQTTLGLYINGQGYPDSASSYRTLYGNGSSAFSANLSGYYIQAGYSTSASATANTFGNTEIYIPNYAGSAYKSFSADGVAESNTSAAEMQFAAGLRANTAAITQIEVSNGYTFQQYSTVTLYGIKNS